MRLLPTATRASLVLVGPTVVTIIFATESRFVPLLVLCPDCHHDVDDRLPVHFKLAPKQHSGRNLK